MTLCSQQPSRAGIDDDVAMLAGGPQEDLDAKFGPLVAALEKLGHRVKIISTDAAGVKASILRQDRYRHEQRQKRVAVDERRPWNADLVEMPAMLGSAPEGATFVTGWLLATSAALAGARHCVPVAAADMAAMRKNAKGLLRAAALLLLSNTIPPLACCAMCM